jgi:endonuclease/exonuclease/phosphatase (EEP) superfamily protein YafD
MPLIVGGDFNLAGNDALLRRLKPRLHDTFLISGTGLGNTLINEFPFVRIDQIWVNDAVRAAHVFVRRTENSDHRMVIADLVLPRNQ